MWVSRVVDNLWFPRLVVVAVPTVENPGIVSLLVSELTVVPVMVNTIVINCFIAVLLFIMGFCIFSLHYYLP